MVDSPASGLLSDCAERFGFGLNAVEHLWAAVSEGSGDMAMFDHPEFAGPGQWMRGGLIMITDPGNYVLKNRIDALCNELSRLFREQGAGSLSNHRRLNANARAWDVVSVERENWWPAQLGEPCATGTGNELSYAYFDASRRLAIRRGSRVTLFDTATHRITGLSQSQQGSASELVFTSQLGEVTLDELEQMPAAEDQDRAPEQTASAKKGSSTDILDALERLGALQRQGVLTEAEFAAKKQELLARL